MHPKGEVLYAWKILRLCCLWFRSLFYVFSFWMILRRLNSRIQFCPLGKILITISTLVSGLKIITYYCFMMLLGLFLFERLLSSYLNTWRFIKIFGDKYFILIEKYIIHKWFLARCIQDKKRCQHVIQSFSES